MNKILQCSPSFQLPCQDKTPREDKTEHPLPASLNDRCVKAELREGLSNHTVRWI